MVQSSDVNNSEIKEVSYELSNQIIEIVNTTHKLTLGSEKVDVTSQTRIAFSKRPAKTVSIPYNGITEIQHYRVWNWYFLACALLVAIIIHPVWLKWLLVLSMLWWSAKYDVVFCLSNGTKITVRYSQIFKASEVSDAILARIKTPGSEESSQPTVPVCPNCGKEIAGTDKFCVFCGNQIP